jgi:septum formation protein
MTRLVLASSSETRARILRDAGVDFAMIPPRADERVLRDRNRGKSPNEIACVLARAKALSVDRALVIGADQLLICEGRLYEKVRSIGDARDTLKALRGRQHNLVTAAALAKDGRIVWEHCETSNLFMRAFSEAFLEDYLARERESVLGSVGCYRIEGRGSQLLAHVEGDNFAIQGLPLLPLLAALRDYGAIMA